MIKYNNNNINDWYYDSNDIAKTYYNGNVTYQRVFKSPPQPQYRTLTTATTCVGFDLHTLEEFQVSLDEGISWETTATSIGALIEAESESCGYVPSYDRQYLTFVAETDNVSFTLVGANSSNVFQYSLDNGSTWNNLQIGQTSPSINTNDKILWKASGLTINQEAGIGVIRPSAAARVQGNIMSLCYSDNFSGQTTIPANFQFRKLFSAATFITSSENMVFPATTITKQAYSQMFQGCTAMTVAPKIIGTSAMTWSGDYCWSDMFHGCTSITTAPILPAATLGTAVYWYMFEDCTNLSNVTCLATSKQNNSTQGWLSNVASSGTFTKHPNATIWGSGANGIPNGWTVQDYSE